ncbi:hypothetical protein ABBQ38_014093 [Trebouxia sp. C0009 RCD-2024]
MKVNKTCNMCLSITPSGSQRTKVAAGHYSGVLRTPAPKPPRTSGQAEYCKWTPIPSLILDFLLAYAETATVEVHLAGEGCGFIDQVCCNGKLQTHV